VPTPPSTAPTVAPANGAASSEEPNRTAAREVPDAGERLSVEREKAVGMAYDHRDLLEDHVIPRLIDIPREIGDDVSNLVGPRRVVEPDRP
jgi:hypothetical protein